MASSRFGRDWDVLEGIDASRRAGWAKYYDAIDGQEAAESLNRALLDVLFDLADAVLAGRSFAAFALAWRIRHGGERDG